MGLAFCVAPHMADAFFDDDAPVVMATPGPTGLALIPAVSSQGGGGWVRSLVGWAGPGKPKRLNHV